MADDRYLDDENENENEDEQQSETSGRRKMLILAGMGLLLVMVSVGVTLLAVKLLSPEPPVVAEEPAETPPVAEGPSLAEESAALAEQEAAKPAEKKQPAIYYPITPPLIVNFDARGRQRFLQAELSLMTRQDDVVSALELHMPMIRNSLILLIGSHLYEDLQTAEGKELLRQQCLQELRRLMEQEIGKPGVEQVLFTNFVMQ